MKPHRASVAATMRSMPDATDADGLAVGQVSTRLGVTVRGDAMDAGVTPGSPEANQLVEWHREVFASYFPLTRQMQVCLGRMFEADPAFAAHYDGIRAGLATWFRRIIDASARAHSIDPDTATWQ